MPLSQRLGEIARTLTGEQVTIRQLMALVGEQGLLLLLIFLTIPFLVPVSIPGVSTLFGAVGILISIGITLNRVPWLPGRIMQRSVDTAALVAALGRGSNLLRRLDGVLRPRFAALTEGALVNRMNGLALLLACVLLIFPLGLVPFSNTLPGWAILLLAAGSLQRDGIVILLGYLLVLGSLLYFGVLGYGAIVAGHGVLSLFGG